MLLLLDSAASCLAPPPSFTPTDPFALHTDPIPVHRARSSAPHKFFQRFARKSNFIIVEVSDISQLGNSLIPLAFPLSLRFCLKWFRFVLCLLPVSLAFSAIVPALSLLACTFPQGSVTLLWCILEIYLINSTTRTRIGIGIDFESILEVTVPVHNARLLVHADPRLGGLFVNT